MTSPRIELIGVARHFPPDTHAVADATFSAAPGEHVALTGRSGSGKTTLLSILGLLDSPTSGTYALDGQPTAGLSPCARGCCCVTSRCDRQLDIVDGTVHAP